MLQIIVEILLILQTLCFVFDFLDHRLSQEERTRVYARAGYVAGLYWERDVHDMCVVRI